MVFLSVVLMPVFRRGTFGADRRILFQTLGRRFRIVVWIMVGILIVSGPLLVSSRTGTLEEPDAWRTALHMKLWVVAGLILLTAAHDFWLGPLVGRLRREASEIPSPADLLLSACPRWWFVSGSCSVSSSYCFFRGLDREHKSY